jgi:hypothetical protein
VCHGAFPAVSLADSAVRVHLSTAMLMSLKETWALPPP